MIIDYSKPTQSMILTTYKKGDKMSHATDHIFENINQRLIERMAEFLDDEYTQYEEAVGLIKDPFPREKSELHIRMANAASAEYKKTMSEHPLSLLEEKGGETPNIIELEKERLEWSLRVFNEATPISSLRKLEEEIKEIEFDINNGVKAPVEYADALMCLLDSAGRHGISVEEILIAFKNKNRINIYEREWIKNPNNTYSHVKKAPAKIK